MLGEGSTGPTDTPCDTLVREGSIRAPCTLRAHRRRGPTTIRAFPTFSSDRGADVLSSNSGNVGRPVPPGVFLAVSWSGVSEERNHLALAGMVP